MVKTRPLVVVLHNGEDTATRQQSRHELVEMTVIAPVMAAVVIVTTVTAPIGTVAFENAPMAAQYKLKDIGAKVGATAMRLVAAGFAIAYRKR